MLAAVNQSPGFGLLGFASYECKGDREIVLAAVSYKPKPEEDFSSSLRFASDELKDDREIVLVALRHDGSALEYASDKLKDDREIVLVALRHDGSALEYASTTLQGDQEIVLEAVNQEWDPDIWGEKYSLKYASVKFWSDREFVLLAVRNDGSALEYASKKLQDDREIVLIAVNHNGQALKYASVKFWSDREFVLLAVRQTGHSLEHASAELKDDPYIVMHAVVNDSRRKSNCSRLRDRDGVFIFASSTLQNGGLIDYVESLINDRYNVCKYIFISTILFGVKGPNNNNEANINGVNEQVIARPRLCDHSGSILRLLRPSSKLPGPFSIQIKQKIGEYAGVRSGKGWHVAKSAFDQLIEIYPNRSLIL